MNNGKLYIKGSCIACRKKIVGCYYCDSDGLTYIEAADTVIVEWLNSLPQDRLEKIMSMVKNESNQN